ncbi:carboxylesterase/lipase family protein [Mucilaginibacter mallensis]|nr:carboxylesterase family protein [Mucilaginibacter mallensis]
MKKIILLLLAIISGIAFSFAQTGSNVQVKITNGLLQGVVETSGIHSFKGIPYAQPPLADLRWKEPRPPKNWAGVHVADHFGPQAMQPPVFSDMMFRSNGKSEDCLYLNVWTPAKSAKEKLPVLVYFYGGGFIAGDGSEYRYDGEALAKKGIVTVTINYRLGIFGFFAHPELTKESPHHSSGNYGLMDQHAALLWVQKNIAAFGGDPDKVTIGGESAGSMSVSAQVASPLSKGLFRGAIGESGAVLGNLSPVPLTDIEQTGVKFAQKAGATTLDDLRKIPADKLMQLAMGIKFSTAVDGYFLPKMPQAIFDAGKQMHVPLLAGWNSAEVEYHSVLGNDSLTVTNYKKALQKLYNDKADDVFNAYPAATDADVAQAATDLASDRFIVFATWKFTDIQSKIGDKPVYRYLFSKKRPPMVNGQGNGNSLGASHASEIEYALGNLSTNKVYAWTPDDYKVSETMQTYFANFIKTGNPNGNGLPQWDKLDSANPKTMVIDVNSQLTPVTNTARYILLESFYNK